MSLSLSLSLDSLTIFWRRRFLYVWRPPDDDGLFLSIFCKCARNGPEEWYYAADRGPML